MFNRFTAVTAAMLIAATGAMAQDAKKPDKKQPPKQQQPAASLKVGDKAPGLSVEKWIKGDEVKSFDANKVYVVEFWATWCPPCRESIPHLTKLQKEYKDKSVTIIGVAGDERPGSDVLGNLKKFVRDKGDQMAYTVAYDSDGSMNKFWMGPAGQNGIPCAFIVGKDGKLAYIGHPMDPGFETALKKAAGGGKAELNIDPRIVLVSQPEKARDAQPAEKTDGKKKATKEKAEEPQTTLYLGDKAPEITVAKWVKGEPVTGFEKGKTYVVEYWATWCGPCKESIPHLTELQKSNKDVKFIGVSVWESDQAAVEPFVKDMGEKMDYTVAMDDVPAPAEGQKPGRADSMKGKMAKTWMAAAGQHGIPTAFIINGDGKVAWIGHPMQMEEPLAKITSGKWDLAKEAADYRKQMEIESKLRPLQRKYQTARATGDTDAELSVIDEIMGLDPKFGANLAPRKFVILLTEKKEHEKAYAFGNELVDGPCKDNAQALNEIAWTIVDPAGDVEKKDLNLAMKAAQKAYEVSKGKDAAITDTLAKVYDEKGDLTKAIEYQEKAAKLAEGDARFEDEIKGRLEEYKEKAKKKGN